MLRYLICYLLCFVIQFLPAQEEAEFYRMSTVEIPEGIALEVGGMDFTEDGKLAVCTRRGEIWMLTNPGGENPIYTLYARGLHEPLGLTVHNGDVYVAQRQEVTLVRDRNDDGKADYFETVYELPLTGNYHEYHYGPLIRPDGTMLATLNVGWHGKGTSRVPWRGWMMQYDPIEEALIPYAAGLRSPAGFGINLAGDVFVAENQGDWIGSGRITHLEKGDFAGHRASLRWADLPGSEVLLRTADITDDFLTMQAAKSALGGVKLPAVWFPHGIMGISTAAIITDRTSGAFGPFAGQMLVSDQGQSKIMRVSLEKVDGEYQGAVFPFREGFVSGTLRMEFGEDNALYVGQTARGWYATGGGLFGLEKLQWTGKVPFEMYQIKALNQGFDIEFTIPVDPSSVRKTAFAIQNFTYLYREAYGSPVVDIKSNTILSVELLPDGKTIRVLLDGLRPAYIYEIRLNGIRGTDGSKLLHDFGFYTLNAIPGGTQSITEEASDLSINQTSPKRPTAMPAAWKGEVDTELLLEAEPGMKYKQTYLSVKAGEKVELTFRNPDDMQHNMILTLPKTGNKVGEAAGNLGLRGLAEGYIPEMDEVIVHTTLVEPGGKDVIYFEAPLKKGYYEYICTVPGHYQSMRGILRVE